MSMSDKNNDSSVYVSVDYLVAGRSTGSIEFYSSNSSTDFEVCSWSNASNPLNNVRNLLPGVGTSNGVPTSGTDDAIDSLNQGAGHGVMVDFIWTAAEPQDYDTYVVVERGGVFIDTDKDGVLDDDEDIVAHFGGDENADLAGQSVYIEFNDVPLCAINLTGFSDNDKVAFDVGSFQALGLMNSSSNSVTKFTFDNYPYFGFNNSTVWFTLINNNSGSWHSSRSMKDFDSNTHSSAIGGLACSSIKTAVNGNTMGVVAFWTDAGNPLNNVNSIFADYSTEGGFNTSSVVEAINNGSNTGLVDFILPTPQPEVYVVVTVDGAYLDSDQDGIKDAGETTAAAFGASANADLSANAVTIHYNAIPTTALDLTGFTGNDKVEVDLTAILNGVDLARSSQSSLGVRTDTPHPPATGWRSRWGSVNGNDVFTDYRSAMHVTDNGKLQLGSLATKPISAGRIGVPIAGATFGLIDTIASNFDFALLASNVDFVAASAPNYAPVITSNGGATQTVSYAENDTDVVGETHALDTNGHLVTYALSGDDSALFNINERTGEVTWKVAPDFETPGDSGTNNVYDFTVTATDGGLNDTQDYAVTVTDVNETPVHVIVDNDGAFLDTMNIGTHDPMETAIDLTGDSSSFFQDNTVVMRFAYVPDEAININGFGLDDRIELAIDLVGDVWLNPSAGYRPSVTAHEGITLISMKVGTVAYNLQYDVDGVGGVIKHGETSLLTWSTASNGLDSVTKIFGGVGFTNTGHNVFTDTVFAQENIINNVGMVDFIASNPI
jgi:hypothetical protein